MKKHLAIILLAAVLLSGLVSCKKIVDTFFAGETFTMPAITMTIPIIPIADSTQEFSGGSFTTYINVDSTIKANTSGVFNINSISTVTVKQVSVTLTNADEINNVSAFKSFRITISSNTNATVANMVTVNIPASAAGSYTYTPTNPANIVDYLKGTNINNAVYGTARKTTTKALNVKVVITLFAK